MIKKLPQWTGRTCAPCLLPINSIKSLEINKKRVNYRPNLKCCNLQKQNDTSLPDREIKVIHAQNEPILVEVNPSEENRSGTYDIIENNRIHVIANNTATGNCILLWVNQYAL